MDNDDVSVRREYIQNCRLLARPVMAAVARRTKFEDNKPHDTSASVTSDYGSGCDVITCDSSKSRRTANLNHCSTVPDVTNDVASPRTSLSASLLTC